jgi:hypothetical protein
MPATGRVGTTPALQAPPPPPRPVRGAQESGRWYSRNRITVPDQGGSPDSRPALAIRSPPHATAVGIEWSKKHRSNRRRGDRPLSERFGTLQAAAAARHFPASFGQDTTFDLVGLSLARIRYIIAQALGDKPRHHGAP